MHQSTQERTVTKGKEGDFYLPIKTVCDVKKGSLGRRSLGGGGLQLIQYSEVIVSEAKIVIITVLVPFCIGVYFCVCFAGVRGSGGRGGCAGHQTSLPSLPVGLTPEYLIFLAVLGIRDILVRIRIPESVPLINGPGPIPGPTPFFIDFRDAKKMLSQNFILQASFQSAQHIYEKREGFGAGSGSVPLTNGSGSGRPKNMRILQIRIWIPNTAF